MIALHEMLFHYQKVSTLDEERQRAETTVDLEERKTFDVLNLNRIDPTVPENLKAWLVLRI